MSKTAIVFPGQGSQFVGMGKDFYEKFQPAKDIFDKADECLGFSLTGIMFDGPEDDLKLTFNTQPALLTMSIALWEVLKDKVNAEGFAGHSLGEYSALSAAGALKFEDAVVAVHNRGKYMQEAVPVGVGAMAAVIGAADELVVELCEKATEGDSVCEPANFNCPGQLVVAGSAEAVDRFEVLAKENKIKRVMKLPVSAPFHCSLMMPAQIKMAEYLDGIQINDIETPVYNNVDAVPETEASVIKEALIQQVSSTVRWTKGIEQMIEDGFDTFIEVGAGKVLSGLIKKINKTVTIKNVCTVDDLEKLEI